MIVMEPCLEGGQSMYLINNFVFSPQNKGYSKKQALLQVNYKILSGVVYLLICKIFMELRLNLDVIKLKIVRYAFQILPM